MGCTSRCFSLFFVAILISDRKGSFALGKETGKERSNMPENLGNMP